MAFDEPSVHWRLLHSLLRVVLLITARTPPIHSAPRGTAMVWGVCFVVVLTGEMVVVATVVGIVVAGVVITVVVGTVVGRTR